MTRATLWYFLQHRRRQARLVTGAMLFALFQKEVSRALLKECRPGRGHSRLPKRTHRRKPIDVYFETLNKREHGDWKLQFGNTSPELIIKIATRLPFVQHRKHKLSPVNQVALFINRLHTGHFYGQVARRFGVSNAQSCNIFFDILYKINLILRSEIYLPSQEELGNIEDILREREEDIPEVRLVIDGTHTYLPYNDGWNSTK